MFESFCAKRILIGKFLCEKKLYWKVFIVSEFGLVKKTLGTNQNFLNDNDNLGSQKANARARKSKKERERE